MKPGLLAVAFLVVLSGCSKKVSDNDAPMVPLQVAPKVERTNRFRVELVSTFNDQLAYNSYRGVYVITDTTTGRQYVGVSGVGISELGAHSCGKNMTCGDER